MTSDHIYQVAKVGCTQNKDETKIIDLIRRHHKSGKKANAIAKYLNAQGIPTKRSKQWTQQGVINILNRLYPKAA